MLARRLKHLAIPRVPVAPATRAATALPPHVRDHYQIECELAHRLRTAPRTERRRLYSALYDELYRRVPEHPQLTTKTSPEESRKRTQAQMDLLQQFIRPDIQFLEIGPGDCALSFHIAARARFVHGVDVSDEVTKCDTPPHNFRLLLSDGTSIPVPSGTVDVAYSNQLMEHLHPEDAIEQLQNVHAALAPGGHYICITPSRLTGPHDVSKYFDEEARGFHLKEYTARELVRLFRGVGFRKLRVAIGGRGAYWIVPTWFVTPIEHALERLPFRLRKKLARRLNFLLGVRLIATR